MSKPIYENIPKLTIQQLKDRLNGKPYIHFDWEGKGYHSCPSMEPDRLSSIKGKNRHI